MELTPVELEAAERQMWVLCPLQYKEDEFCEKRKRKLKALREQTRKRLIEKLVKNKSNMVKNISGVNIDFSNPSVAAAKSITDFKKMDFFSHLSKTDADAAYKELMETVEGSEPKNKEKEKGKDE